MTRAQLADSTVESRQAGADFAARPAFEWFATRVAPAPRGGRSLERAEVTRETRRARVRARAERARERARARGAR